MLSSLEVVTEGLVINPSQLCEILSMFITMASDVFFIDLIASEAANTSLYRSLRKILLQSNAKNNYVRYIPNHNP